MKRFLVLTTIVALVWGCAHTRTEQVMVPPQVDLQAYDHIGVITFSSNTDDSLKQYATQHFLQAVQEVQPGVRFLELGSHEQLLSSVQRAHLDLETIKALGRKFQVDAILYGHFAMSKMKPNVQLSSLLSSLSAQASVTGTLNTKLWETDSGATVWTSASSRKASVANLSVGKQQPADLGFGDPQEKYGELVQGLVYDNTVDFRPQYIYKKVRE